MKRGRVFALASGGLAIACGIIVACGGDSSDTPPLVNEGGTPPPAPNPPPPGPGDGAVPPPPPAGNYVVPPPGSGTQLCTDTYEAVKAWYEPCCNATDKTTQDYKLVDAFLTFFDVSCGQELESSITKGRVGYDPTILAQCKQDMDTLLGATQCGGNDPSVTTINPLKTGGSCTRVFQGKQAAGQACARPYECGPGLACVGYAMPSGDAGVPVEGTCVAQPSLDGGCGQAKLDGGNSISFNLFFEEDLLECAPGGYCSQTFAGKCIPQKTAQGSCFEDKECQAGLHCFIGKCDTAGPSAANGPCGTRNDCASGLYCNRPSGSATGSCQPREAAGLGCSSGISSQCKGRCVVPDGGAADAGTCQAFCSSG